MIMKRFSVFFIWTVFIFWDCESAFVDNLVKCSKEDNACLKDVIQSVLRDTAKTGIPEYSIPPFDPYVIQNETFSVLDMLDVSLFEGVAKGIKDCEINNFELNFETKQSILELTCDVKIKGRYSAYGSSDLIKQLLGGQTVHGNGRARIVIDKLHMKSLTHFNVISRDGDVFLSSDKNDIKFSFDIGKMSFAADNLYLGDTEASALVTNIMNENWKFIIDTAGKPFLDRSSQIIYEQSFKFFGSVPAKFYLADDLSQYVTK